MVRSRNDGTAIRQHRICLENGEMSAPFKSPFGYHIILKEAQRGVPPLDSLRDNILTAMKYDGRMDIARQAKIDGLFKKYGITPDQAKRRNKQRK